MLPALLVLCVLCCSAPPRFAAVRAEQANGVSQQVTGVCPHYSERTLAAANAIVAAEVAAAEAAAAVERRRLQEAQLFDNHWSQLTGFVSGSVNTISEVVSGFINTTRPLISSAFFVFCELLFRRHLVRTVVTGVVSGGLLMYKRAGGMLLAPTSGIITVHRGVRTPLASPPPASTPPVHVAPVVDLTGSGLRPRKCGLCRQPGHKQDKCPFKPTDDSDEN